METNSNRNSFLEAGIFHGGRLHATGHAPGHRENSQFHLSSLPIALRPRLRGGAQLGSSGVNQVNASLLVARFCTFDISLGRSRGRFWQVAPVGGVSRFVSSKAHFGKGSESGQEREGARTEAREGEERTRKKERGRERERERERKRMLFLCTAVACSTRCHVTGALHSVTSRGHSVIDQLEGAVNPLTTRLFVPLRYHDLLTIHQSFR